mmetsp:Transcript_115857/g.188749  ORF Transcript_115857/g.188749 Transcript_115857/m.188749 type:complete len:94 (+) Transcript_115857:292-573(+)
MLQRCQDSDVAEPRSSSLGIQKHYHEGDLAEQTACSLDYRQKVLLAYAYKKHHIFANYAWAICVQDPLPICIDGSAFAVCADTRQVLLLVRVV